MHSASTRTALVLFPSRLLAKNQQVGQVITARDVPDCKVRCSRIDILEFLPAVSAIPATSFVKPLAIRNQKYKQIYYEYLYHTVLRQKSANT